MCDCVHSTEENIAWIFPPLCSRTQLQHFMVEENTTVHLGSPCHSQSQHFGPWGPLLRQGFPGSLNDDHMPQSGQLALNPQRKRPGIGPYWKFLFDWVVDDLKGPFWLGNPLRLSMKSVNPCGRETLQNSGERRQHYRKLSSGEVGLGADAWPRPAAPHGSVFVKIVTLSPRPPGLIYGTVGKQLPEQHVPPLDY